MVIREAGETDDEAPANYKPTGKNRVFTIAKVDEVPENRHNVEKLLDSQNLPDFKEDFQYCSRYSVMFFFVLQSIL